mmetsp:Transcript_7744/g.21734  ORF Transcript_7744/g.21734 Transcript_7744/m.21734 type:complete len:297 (-) Transcript_7744:2805-3695(-)
MSISNSCTTHCVTTWSLRNGSCPSLDTAASSHMIFLGMLSPKRRRMLAVTFCHASGFRVFPVCNSSCLNPSTPIRATASASCWMQFSIRVSTSSSRNDSASRCASKSLTRDVRACKHVGAISAARHAGGPGAAPSDGRSGAPPSGFRWSLCCSWWWMSSNRGFITPLKIMRQVSSSKTALPCCCRQSKTPESAAPLTSRRASLTSIESPRRMGNQCAAGWLALATAPDSVPPVTTWTPARELDGGGGGSGLLLSARYSVACSRYLIACRDMGTLAWHWPNASNVRTPSLKFSTKRL